jgi:hypothetical protein
MIPRINFSSPVQYLRPPESNFLSCRSDQNATVSFTIEGLGQRIGENPVRLRAGKMIDLAQSGFVLDELTVSAASPGLRPAKVAVKTTPVVPGVDMPRELPGRQPTRRALVAPSRTPR